jgi:ABC-type glycerol-3-phosphate transport system permease component
MKIKLKFTSTLKYLLLAVGAFASLFPFYWMVISSFKPEGDMFKFPPDLFPTTFTVENYIELLRDTDFARNLGNSIFVAVCFTVVSVFLCALCGYTFAKLRFPGREFLFGVVIATMSLPLEITLIPLFKLMTSMRWINTYWSVIIPFAATAWGVFLMRQSMMDIPDELLDAARIDGASEFQIFSLVVVPVVKPAMGALAILQFLSSWNDYIWPLIALTENKMMTVPVALALFKSGYFANYGSITAGAFLSSLPIIIVFFALQKFFVRGALFGSVKG